MNGYQFVCGGFQHGSDPPERLDAAHALVLDSDDVAIEKAEAGLHISITGERAQQGHLFFSIAASSLLIFWTGPERNSSDEDTHRPTLSIASLPQLTDPSKAVVSYHADRVHLHLPYSGSGRSLKTLDMSGAK